jgi:hypothetical protein
MRIKRLLTAIVFIVVAGVITFKVVHASDKVRSDDDLVYTVEETSCGSIRVRVEADLSTHKARERYAVQQREKALEVVRSNKGESIPVQITFAYPLSTDELQKLAQDENLKVEMIIFEARDPSYNLHTVAALDSGAGKVVDPDSLQLGLDMRNLQLIGVTAVRGIVPASTGLGELIADERVYIPDVTPYLLAVEVSEQRDVEMDRIQVSVPTPHWYISAERDSSVGQ